MPKLILLLLLCSLQCAAQKNSSPPEDEGLLICGIDYRSAVFPGNTTALRQFIQHHFDIPSSYEDTVQRPTRLTIYMTILVGRDGKASCAVVRNSPSPAIDSACNKLAGMMPRWKPATQNGRVIKYFVCQPITMVFEVEDSSQEEADSLRRVKKKTPTPDSAIKLPQSANHCVDTSKKSQIPTDRIIGKGKSHILNGNPSVPYLLRSSIAPTPWPMNCTMMRMASIELITSPNRIKRLNTKPMAHNTINDT